MGFLTALLALLGVGIQSGIGFKEIGRSVAIDVPLGFPIFGQHGLDIVEHAGLDIQGNAAVESFAVHVGSIGIPCTLRNLLIAFHVIDG